MDTRHLDFKHQPIVGVFITNKVIRLLKRRDYNFTSYIRLLELARAAMKAEVNLYFFSYKNVKTEQRIIYGTYLDLENKKWSQDYFPFPDVLYDRIGSRHPSVLSIREFLEKDNILRINSRYYFNKWEVYEDLSEINNIRQYLPLTELYVDKEGLQSFIEEHSIVYLKGVKSGRGRGVMRVTREDDKYTLSHFRDQIEVHEIDTFEDLYEEILAFYEDKPFLMQDAIDLISLNGNKVDFRAEVQRNGDGKLIILGISARIAKENSPITIHSSALKINEFFTNHYGYTQSATEELMTKVNSFVKDIYLSLEEVYGPFGEIGIDFGIDNQGKIWFIEPNSKTAKVSLMKAYDMETFRQAFLNPLYYAKHLVYNKQPVG